MRERGWLQIGFERDVQPTSGSALADEALLIVRNPTGLRVFSAACPHRGANLSCGGTLDGDSIICPFHGLRVRLGAAAEGLWVKEHASLAVGGLVFVLSHPADDRGFREYLVERERHEFFVPGFTMRARVSPRLVIENAFDAAHFRPVHRILNEPIFEVNRQPGGPLEARGTFAVPSSQWQRAAPEGSPVEIPILARAFGPGLVVTEMGGSAPYSVLTSAVQDGADPSLSVIRLSLIVPPGARGEPPEPAACDYLLRQSRGGLEADRVIWENLQSVAPSHMMQRDAAVQAFRDFCAEVGEEPA